MSMMMMMMMIMSVFLERFSMLNMINCAAQVQVQKYQNICE